MSKQSLVKSTPTDLDIPAYIKQGDVRGTEHITREDVQMPRLALAQAQSPQLLEDHPKYIDGLKLGQLFNNLTGQIYGKGPLEFCIVRADPPRGVEFNPLEQGGGVKDLSVPLDDPRMQFGPNGEKPVATKFYDYVVMLLPSRELVSLSFKSTGLKVARRLNGLIKLRNIPLFAAKYSLTTTMEKNKAGTFAQYVIGNAGVVDEATYHVAEQAYDTFKHRAIAFDRDASDEFPNDDHEM